MLHYQHNISNPSCLIPTFQLYALAGHLRILGLLTAQARPEKQKPKHNSASLIRCRTSIIRRLNRWRVWKWVTLFRYSQMGPIYQALLGKPTGPEDLHTDNNVKGNNAMSISHGNHNCTDQTDQGILIATCK